MLDNPSVNGPIASTAVVDKHDDKRTVRTVVKMARHMVPGQIISFKYKGMLFHFERVHPDGGGLTSTIRIVGYKFYLIEDKNRRNYADIIFDSFNSFTQEFFIDSLTNLLIHEVYDS